MRSQLSAFVITFNEEEQIGDCLESLSFCDEVVVIDSFSKDRTVQIAEQYGARVIQRAWPGYRDQKAFGLKSTKYEWVLNVDADERVSPELRDSILSVLEEDAAEGQRTGRLEGYYINRVIFHLGRWWRRGGWYPEYRLRFFRREHASWGGTDPHEKAIVKGKTTRLSGELLHYTYKDLDDQFQRLQKYSKVAALEDFRKGKRAGLKQLVVSPVVRFIKFYFIKQGFKEGVAGLIVAAAEAFYTFMKYAKLWELQRGLKHEGQ